MENSFENKDLTMDNFPRHCLKIDNRYSRIELVMKYTTRYGQVIFFFLFYFSLYSNPFFRGSFQKPH